MTGFAATGNVLALDTATAAVTVAVAHLDDGRAEVLAARTTVDARRHGELLAPSVAAVLAEAGLRPDDLTTVVVGVGPGPFTGLRVGLVTARTMGHALGLTVLGVVTHDVLAQQAAEEGLTGEVAVVTDARRREVHVARYVVERAGPSPVVRRTSGPEVAAPATAATAVAAVGAGAALYAEHFPGARDPAHPDAAAICRGVAAGLEVVDPEPRYLRRPDVAPPAAPKQVLR